MKEVSPLKAIRLKCLDCSCNSLEEVRECFAKKCPLYQYRFGYRLDENGKKRKVKTSGMSEEQREQARQRMKEYQAKRKAEKENQ